MAEATHAVSLATTLKVLDAQGQRLRVEFQRNGDRFEHTILGVRDGEETPLLKSIEGTSDEIAPASPPFAELHRQGETVFLSGATTLGHWSMSVQATDGRLKFDVACRLKNKADWLGSTYRVVDENYLLGLEDAAQTKLQQDRLLVMPFISTDDCFPTTIQWRYSIATRK